MHAYEIHPRKDHRGVDLISDALPFGRLWYDTPDNAIGYAMHSSRSHDALIRVDAAGNVIESHQHKAISKTGGWRAKQSVALLVSVTADCELSMLTQSA